MFKYISSILIRDSSPPMALSDTQSRMYASEQTENFRWVARTLALHSSHILTSSDVVPEELQLELDHIGQFAELAHGTLSPEFIWQNMDLLLQPNFPLDGYDALRGSKFVSAFQGTVQDLQAYLAYRGETKQMIVAFSGTSSVPQALHNLAIWLTTYPGGNACTVHAGFWKMYMGIRDLVLGCLKSALLHHEVDELVLTGHSLGGVLCYLFGLSILGAEDRSVKFEPASLPRLKIAVFGCPRIGNLALAELWREFASRFSVVEYSVKAYNDGATAIPPFRLGYRHFCQSPMYLAEGHLFHIPSEDSECSYFTVRLDAAADGHERPPPEHPRGGHNYYNGRDMEKTLRRMSWLELKKLGAAGWEERYLRRRGNMDAR